MKILKFGGTSVQNSNSMLKVIEIIKSCNQELCIVVLSACFGITNLLEKISELSVLKNNDEWARILADIEKHHKMIAIESITDLKLRNNLISKIRDYIEEIHTICIGVNLLNECSPKTRDYILSFGEILSTTCFYYLCLDHKITSYFEDSRKIFKTDSNFNKANIDFTQTQLQLQKTFKKYNNRDGVIILQGFIASNLENITTTLGRGGSDYTASVVGSLINAEEIQIWTDVTGVYSADPRIILNANPIPNLNFEETKLLSFFGAKVLHPDTIKPAINKNIIVKVLNTFEPDKEGTIIMKNIDEEDTKVHSLVMNNNCLSINIKNIEINTTFSFINKLQSFLKSNNIKIFQMFSIDNIFSLIIEKFDDKLLSFFNNTDNISITPISIILICGVNFKKNGSLRNKLIKQIVSIGQLDINSFHYGISDESIIITTSPEKDRVLLNKLHSKLISDVN